MVQFTGSQNTSLCFDWEDLLELVEVDGVATICVHAVEHRANTSKRSQHGVERRDDGVKGAGALQLRLVRNVRTELLANPYGVTIIKFPFDD